MTEEIKKAILELIRESLFITADYTSEGNVKVGLGLYVDGKAEIIEEAYAFLPSTNY